MILGRIWETEKKYPCAKIPKLVLLCSAIFSENNVEGKYENLL